MFAVADGIGCFICHSLNGSDPSCEDPFDARSSLHLQRYWGDCLADEEGSTELVPASHCIKVSGTYCEFQSD